jgi:hypothetical protein
MVSISSDNLRFTTNSLSAFPAVTWDSAPTMDQHFQRSPGIQHQQLISISSVTWDSAPTTDQHFQR